MEREEDVLNISFQSVLQDNKEELNDYKNRDWNFKKRYS